MKSFLRAYMLIFVALIFSSYLLFNFSMRMIFSDKSYAAVENVLGTATQQPIPKTGNTIIINPKRAKEKDETRLEVFNGIMGDYVYIFDNENHNFIEGESVPDHNLYLTIGDYRALKRVNPDGFFSFELPSQLKQFQKSTLQLRSDSFQTIRSFSFIFVQKKFMGRYYFLNPQNNVVFSIQVPDGYKATMGSYQSIDNTLCKLENRPGEHIADFQNITEGLLVFPNPLTLEAIRKKEFAILKVSELDSGLELSQCIDQFKATDLKLEWHTSTILDLISSIQPAAPTVPVSDPLI